MDEGGAAWMCSCLKESRLRERPGTSGEEETLPRGDRPVLCPRLNWEGGAAWNDQNWYHAGSSELGPLSSPGASQVRGTHFARDGRRDIKAS